MNPKTTDRINYSLSGCTVKFLGLDDVLQPTDFVRELYEDPCADGGWCNPYKSDKWRGTFWHKVKDDLPGWIGKTYREYLEFRGEHNAIMEHEIVRII